MPIFAWALLTEWILLRRDYAIGLRCELERKTITDPKRNAELAAYFTHIKLEPNHVVLAARVAASIAFKMENYGLAAGFARRMLELNAPPRVSGVSFNCLPVVCELGWRLLNNFTNSVMHLCKALWLLNACVLLLMIGII